MNRSALALAFFALARAFAGSAAADELRPSDGAPPAPLCLDEENTHKGVQERTFLKRRRVELVPQGGLYASDLLSSSYAYGGSLAFYVTEDFGLEASFAVTPIALDVDDALTDFFGDSRFTAGRGYLGLAALLWAPIHFKVKTSGESILHGDILFALGGGKLWSETTQGFAFQAGPRVELYLLSWLSLRLDVRDVLLIQEAVAETRLTNNIVVLGGLGVWLP